MSGADEQDSELSFLPLRRAAEGDEAFLLELLTLLHRDNFALTGSLADAVAAGDTFRAQRYAHTLRSQALNLGSERLGAIFDKLEHDAERGDMESVAHDLPAALLAMAHARELVWNHIETHRA